MANPKRRFSLARSRRRRAQWKAALPAFETCPSCGKPKLRHHACTNYGCGRYRVAGEMRQVIHFRQRRKLEQKS